MHDARQCFAKTLPSRLVNPRIPFQPANVCNSLNLVRAPISWALIPHALLGGRIRSIALLLVPPYIGPSNTSQHKVSLICTLEAASCALFVPSRPTTEATVTHLDLLEVLECSLDEDDPRNVQHNLVADDLWTQFLAFGVAARSFHLQHRSCEYPTLCFSVVDRSRSPGTRETLQKVVRALTLSV